MLQSAAIHRPAGEWPEHETAGALTLNFEERHRRRIQLVTDQGEEVLLDLPKATAMADGDGLRLGDGRWLKIRSAAEPVVEVRHNDAGQLTRLAWHLGNRHLPTEIGQDVLRIRPDHVIESMLEGFGADLLRKDSPFQPEGGAYGNHGQPHDPAGPLHQHEQ